MIASMNSATANLHVQLNDITIELALVLLKSSLDLGVDELLDDLRAATDEVARVGESVDVGEDGLEEWPDLDALDQVVVLAFLLDDSAGLVGEHADLLVGVLAGVALLDHGHDDVLGCHERQFHLNALLDDGRVDDKAGRNVVELKILLAYKSKSV